MTQNPEPFAGYQPPVPPPQPSSLDLPPLAQTPVPQGPPPTQPLTGYAPPPPASATPTYGQSQYSPYATPSYGQAYHPNPAAYPVPTPSYTPVPPLGAADPDVQANRVMAILAYLNILVIIPLLAARKSGFARFHTNQGLILFIGWVILGVLAKITSSVLITLILGLLSLGIVFLAVLGIINVVNGKRNQLPVVGKIKIL